MTKNSLYLIFATALLGLVLYYADSPEKLLGTPEQLKEKPKVFPYAVADNAATRYYSPSGELDYTFNAQRLEHYRVQIEDQTAESKNQTQFDEYTLIDEPKLIIFMPDKSWHIESRKGKISDQGNTITLWNDVKVWQEEQPDKNTRLSTEVLKILPVEKYAETNEPVKIVSPNGEITAIGMQVSFINRKIKLLSQVRAQHDPF